ncbi:polysaccharide pyruvyl transferase family protein [Halobacillus trueperi]|uniref:polysaccharide pyruvyl transferase family protein n=1 Tax=Halobacillus trueperi TaxID=156205 RepID=UPI003735EBB6
MKKILVSAYYNLNLGDDLFIKVLADRYPNIEWHLLTDKKEYKKVFRCYKNVKVVKMLNLNIFGRTLNLHKKINDSLLNYRKYDAYLVIGGSIFMEYKGWEAGLIAKAETPKIFKEQKKGTFIIGANFGPYSHEKYLQKHKEFFEYFDDVCFRDNYSLNLFKDKNNIRVASDVVFNLEYNNLVKDPYSIGISIIDLSRRRQLKRYKNDYNSQIIKIIEHYLEKDYTVKLFSFCEREGDLKSINEILHSLHHPQKDKIKVINYTGDINKTLNEFQSCNTIIGTRFHSIVLAFLFNQNIFPIIYSDKSYNLISDLNMKNQYTYIKDIKNMKINEIIEGVNGNTFSEQNIINSAVAQFESFDKAVSS